MRLFKTRLAILVLALVFSSCEFLPFFSDSKKKKDDDEEVPAQSWGISFDITGAKAIAATGTTSSGSISAAARAALDRATDADAALVKVMEDGSIVDAIDLGENMTYIPKVSFLTVGSDGSVYVCFESHLWVYSESGSRGIQFIRIYPEATKPFDILWPPASSDMSMSAGSVRTWTWWGMDNDPLVKGPDGKLYFIIQTFSSNGSTDTIYRYDPSTGEAPQAQTPAAANLQIENFQVDSQNRLFVKSPSYGTSSFLRYYLPNVTAPTNIYYTSDSSTWVRGYTPDPAGRFLVLNGNGINKKLVGSDQGLSGIVKATFDTIDPKKFSFSTVYPSSNGWVRYYMDKNDTWQSGTEILDYDGSNSAAPWSWHADVVDGTGIPVPAKIIDKIKNAYADTPVWNNTPLPTSTALNNPWSSYSRLGDAIFSYSSSGPNPFVGNYFTGTTFNDWLDAQGLSSLDMNCIGSMLWLSDSCLYGLYDTNWWGSTSSDTSIVKLLNSSGERDLKVVKLQKGNQKPTQIKAIGNKFFYRYALANEFGSESGTHQLAWTDPVTNAQAVAILPSSVPEIEVLSYDVTSDAKELYFVGFVPETNSILSGKVDLTTGTFTPSETAANLTKIRVID